MKTKHRVIFSCLVIAGLILSGIALADSPAQSERKGFGFNRHYKGGGLMLLAKYQQKNLMIQVLSELSGQPSEDIEAKLKDQRMRAVMQELNIDRQAFRTAMHTKISQQIKAAAANGSITAEQEKEIIDRMENRKQRREMMSRLIEKGVADGTITQAQAQMLMRKPR